MITTVSLVNSEPLLLELLALASLAYCSQKIVFFVMLTMTLKVMTMKTWMVNLLMVTLKVKTLTMKTWMENLLMYIHTSPGTSLGIETLKFYIWLEMTPLIEMMMYGNNLPCSSSCFPSDRLSAAGSIPRGAGPHAPPWCGILWS